jgi:hypothetical protein
MFFSFFLLVRCRWPRLFRPVSLQGPAPLHRRHGQFTLRKCALAYALCNPFEEEIYMRRMFFGLLAIALVAGRAIA